MSSIAHSFVADTRLFAGKAVPRVASNQPATLQAITAGSIRVAGSKAVHIAIDANNIVVDTQGIGRYVRTLLRTYVHDRELELTLLLRNIAPWLSRRRIAAIIGGDQFGLSTRVPSSVDVVWHPWNGTFFASPFPSVVTMHDAVPFAFPSADPARRSAEQEPFLRSARTASLVIAVSHAGARDIVARVGVPQERVRVVYHGVAPIFSPDAGERAGSYLLFVGNAGQRLKNFALLHRAYTCAWPHGDGPGLVAVGGSSVAYAGVRSIPAIRKGGAGGHGDQRIRDLYRGALALCVPSLYESFGMPMLEAMACGTPVLAARTGAMPELSGGAAWLLDPMDEKGWTAALRTIAEDKTLRARFRAAGLAHTRTFRWEQCAAQTLDVLREAAHG